MADLVSSILNAFLFLWDTMGKRAVRIRNRKENLESLEVAMERLNEIYEDVKELVERGEQLRLLRKHTNEVGEWLQKVQRMEAKVSEILQEGKEEMFSSNKVENRVSKMLNEVNELITEGRFRAPVNEKPMEKTVGLESMLKKVWRCIEDRDLRIIGLYGLGGVGKTTLLKKVNNEFLKRSHGFDAVIWVSVSKQPDSKKIQDEILREFQIHCERTEKMLDKIYSILKEKKIVLLLDGMWERLNLAELGVPIRDMQKGSKVVFTTRSLGICCQMEAERKLKVECLTSEAALDLFLTKVGKDTLNSHPRISKLAEIMAAECKGLPLALITVGRAMASRKSPEEWEQAISILRNSPSHFPGMNDVLRLLKLSFDRLENNLLKSCFLYCSLFPEDYNISKEELIELWIGEGFLGKSVDVYGRLINDRNEVEYIIGSLKRACLLESGESEEFVTMHQMIRNMALWECGGTIKIYVRRDAQSTQAYGSGSWNEIERMSLWDPRIEDLEAINNTQVPNLLTYICRAPMITTFPTGILLLMPALSVLDLSKSSMLCEVPAEICKLTNLQYLNMSQTAISELPTALRNLTKLRCLLLDCTRLKIQREIISNFLLLEVFSTTTFCDEDLLDELEHLQHISEISLEISTATSLARLFRSPKLQQCLKKLNFCSNYGLPSISVSPALLRRLERLELNSVSLKEFKISPETGYARHHYFDNMCGVVIRNCSVSDATWLIYAPRLQHLTLYGCRTMEEVIGLAEIEESVDLFSSIKTLHLEGLPKLKSICQQALPFPSLMKIKVKGCPNLKKLPFDSNSAKNSLKQIYGEISWWEELWWEDKAIKQVFSSKFVEN